MGKCENIHVISRLFHSKYLGMFNIIYYIESFHIFKGHINSEKHILFEIEKSKVENNIEIYKG
jgi:hypothetical protein